jgi:hypothetical protein|nr:MAG TPA: hypothetical protein [Caudoviricetes sp.]DAQ75510.1 MAG TPA: hypothetical protein [Caudoviricetes sp.]
MVLYVDMNKKIYGYNEFINSDQENKDSITYEGSFSFEQGEEKEGYNKVFYFRNGKIELDYEPILDIEPSMEEKIYTAVSKSQDEIRQEGADSVMEELVKRGLIV